MTGCSGRGPKMMNMATKWLSAWVLALGALVFLSTAFGVVHFYSPIPWWDEWDGYIGFYRNITTGYLAGWWIPHMEHRILFPRILFWLDICWFGGQHYFLFFAQQAMQAGMVLILWREYARGKSLKAPWAWMVGLPLALLFSWVQSETFKWGFEIQVVAVYFFAFWAAAQFSRLDEPRVSHVAAALVLACFAEISMGNGMLAFAMLLGQGIVARRPARELLLVLIVGAVMWTVYFIGYTKPPEPHLSLTARELATNYFQFFLAFLGNPLAFVQSSLLVCMIAGGFTLAIAVWLVLYLYVRREITPYRLFLIGGYGFIVLTDLAAMSGRAIGGAGAATASRYTTGPLLTWVLLSFLAFDTLKSALRRQLVILATAVVATVMVTYQHHVRDDSSYLYNWKLAALSHKIGLDHPDLDGLLFPPDAHDHFTSLADFAASQHVALYGKGWLRDAGSITYRPDGRDDTWCEGAVESMSTDSVGLVAKGWALSKDGAHDLLIVLTDRGGNIVGYGVTGEDRRDIAKTHAGSERTSGWIGFSKRFDGPIDAYAYRDKKFCLLGTQDAARPSS